MKKTKIFLSLFVLLIVCLLFTLPTNVNAEEVSVLWSGTDENIIWIITSDGKLTLSGQGEIKDYSDTSLAPWSSYKDYINHVEIKSGITCIGKSAFYNCSNVRYVYIPGTVKVAYGEYGSSPFYKCSENLIIYCETDWPESWHFGWNFFHEAMEAQVLYNRDVSEFLYWATLDKTSEYIVIPEGITDIPDYTFKDCETLKGITLSSTIKTIGRDAFFCCSNLSAVTLNEGLETIEMQAFFRNYALEEITLPKSLKRISSGAFKMCIALKSMEIPSNVEFIGNQIFYTCNSLMEISILSRDCYIYPFNDTISKRITIKGYKDSTAYQYASGFGRTFVDLSTGEKTEFVMDNSCFLNMLPTKDITYGEPACQMVRYRSLSGYFAGYSMKTVHESDITKAEYVELKNFTDKLVAGCSSDYEKVVTIANWVHENLVYEIGAIAGNTIDSVYNIFSSKRGNCMCFTQLTNYMLYLEGIPTVDIVSASHEWGAALINGEWINVDATNCLINEPGESYDLINSMVFSSGELSFAINNCSTVYLAGIGYDEEQAKSIKEVTIPDFVTGIYDSAFWNTCDELIVHGTKGSYADIYVQKNFDHVTYEGDTFTAYNDIESELSGVSDVEDSDDSDDALQNVYYPEKIYTITFDANGGSRLSTTSINLTVEECFGTLPTVTRRGYIFKGWYTQIFGGEKITASDKPTRTMKLYAQWEKVYLKRGSIVKLSGKSRGFTVKVKKVSGVKGYELRYSKKVSMKGAKKLSFNKTSKTVKKLKAKKKYYVQVRSYKLDSMNKKVYSAWSDKEKVKTKK